jgi:heptosyltransferase I
MPELDAKKICLVRPSAIGDTVHALALANGLRHGFPDARITWVLQPVPCQMVMHQPCVDRFITFERKGTVIDWLNLFRRLRKDRYDLAVIPQASGKTSLIAAALRSTVKLGFDWGRSREMHWLATNHHIPANAMGHVQDQLLEFLAYLDINDYSPFWDFCFTNEEKNWRRSFFSEIGKPVVGFVISSAHPEKDWHPEKYAQVIDHVAQNPNLVPMLIGGPSTHERNAAARIAGLCRSVPKVALEKPIRRTMLQLSGCRLVISPDTGPLHVAVALNTPVVGLYGYSNPKRCGPYKKFHDLLVDKYNDPGEENAPITRKTKPGRMAAITVAEVIEKIERGLEQYAPSHASGIL